MEKSFGTDGVRGIANLSLTVQDALSLAQASGRVLCKNRPNKHRFRAVIAHDSRPSGAMLQSAVIAGLTSVGVDVVILGVVPTPVVSFSVQQGDYDFGVMITASHNPAIDNGIKFFGRDGKKLSNAQEAEIESIWSSLEDVNVATKSLTGKLVGRVSSKDIIPQYISYLSSLFISSKDDQKHSSCRPLSGLSIVLDTANGAAKKVAPEIFSNLGAYVRQIGDASGDLINDHCGSLHLEALQKTVIKEKADIGIAFDGDADRCLLIASDGQICDGDVILAILGEHLGKYNLLHQNTVVLTVMSNFSVHKFFTEKNIETITTNVGDKYVYRELMARNLSLGGEQSGHVIIPSLSTTGDGILTGLLVTSLLRSRLHKPTYNESSQIITNKLGEPIWVLPAEREKKTLEERMKVIDKLPQVQINVPVVDKKAAMNSLQIHEAIKKAESVLQNDGRILVRASGTEDILRILVESTSLQLAQKLATDLVGSVRTL